MMENTEINLQALRNDKRLSQAQLSKKLSMCRTAYSKLERGITQLTLQKLFQIARVLNMELIEIINKYDMKHKPIPFDNNYMTEKSSLNQEKLDLYKETVLSLILTRFIKAQQEFEEPIPFEELDDYDKMYLDICEIETKEDYEQAGLLISRTTPGKDQEVFETMIEDIDIYKFFEFGLVDFPHLLSHWETFKGKNRPIFKFKNGMASRIKRPDFDSPPF